MMPKGATKTTPWVAKTDTPPWKPEMGMLEWELMGNSTCELTPPMKRGLSSETSEREGMEIEKDEEREQRLMAQIAILQRELDVMKNKNNA